MGQLPELPRYYTALVNYVEDAIEQLERFNREKAREFLLKGLQEAENIFIEMSCDREGMEMSGKNPLYQQQQPQAGDTQNAHHQGIEQVHPQAQTCKSGGGIKEEQGAQPQQGIQTRFQSDFQGGGKHPGTHQGKEKSPQG